MRKDKTICKSIKGLMVSANVYDTDTHNTETISMFVPFVNVEDDYLLRYITNHDGRTATEVLGKEECKQTFKMPYQEFSKRMTMDIERADKLIDIAKGMY